MANPTLTVTPEPGNTPPRVRLDIADAGTPAVATVTPRRTEPDGSTAPVRTPTGVGFALTASGTSRVGTLYDYEMPLGAPVAYTLDENPAVAGSARVDSEAVWLIHPGVPSRSIAVDLRPASFAQVTRAVNRGVFWPMTRETPIVITDGRRKAAETSIVIRTDTLDDILAVVALTADAQTLMLNAPPALALGVTRRYISVGDITEERPSDIGQDAYRDWTLPYVVVDRPEGGSQAQWTLADIKATYADLATIKARFTTMADIQANTPH
jgi:hypothetical protein